MSFQRHDADICIGRDLDEAVELALTVGPAGEIIRLAEEEGERLLPEVRDAIRNHFSNMSREDGSVWAGSSAWFVTAYNPA